MVQADVRQLLLSTPLGLEADQVVLLEAPVGDRKRIDVETGLTVIEVKKDLRKGTLRTDAALQLSGYVAERQRATGCRYIGILTDGADWTCYHLNEGVLAEVSTATLRPADPDSFIVWLEGVLATASGVPPTPHEIETRLGARSSAHALERATLTALFTKHRTSPLVQMKRLLWSRLLTTALGTQFEDSDELFIEHTLVVNTAEIIAHAILGLDVVALNPVSLLTGTAFDESRIYGVIEADFFDWAVEVPDGTTFVRSLAKRLSRFEWAAVEHDVLKTLYESVIGAETRKKLGEYYTPDWLAEIMVDTTISQPLSTRVLDPACGSGTFLFAAVRRYLRAADETVTPTDQVLRGLTDHVIGMDLHPVAVTLARVTYLLAIGRDRLSDPRRGDIRVPVYLGDSLQWQEQRIDLLYAGHLVIKTTDQAELFATELRFPNALLGNAQRFDELVTELATKAAARKPGSTVPSLNSVFQRLAIPSEHHQTLTNSFKTMCRLHDEGRNHIWGYYVRNLARPVWLSHHENRVDLLIGNPPWLAYRHMSSSMQRRFREMSELRSLWHGAKVATHQDLSALFVARAVQLYLRQGGRFAFVMPNAVLDRRQYQGFRDAWYPDPDEQVQVKFRTPWNLKRLRPHFFPIGSAVIFGNRNEPRATMPANAEEWTGRLPKGNARWADVGKLISRGSSTTNVAREAAASPYQSRFTQGASLVPRLLTCVEVLPPGPLGLPTGRVRVASLRSANEKRPWSELPPHSGVVESEFVRPTYLASHVLPYRVLPPIQAVVPRDAKMLLDSSSDRLDLYPGLAAWWRGAEDIWLANRKSDRLSLLEQIDFRNKLSCQFPIPGQRVVYNKSGMHLVAARITDPRAVLDHTLYWATTESNDEAHYLCAILNSETVLNAVRPLMSYGKDERHVDKYVWQLPIPQFSPHNRSHIDLATLGQQAEESVTALSLHSVHFSRQRRAIRDHLQATLNPRIELAVSKVMSQMVLPPRPYLLPEPLD